jgi:hypothetical protein
MSAPEEKLYSRVRFHRGTVLQHWSSSKSIPVQLSILDLGATIRQHISVDDQQKSLASISPFIRSSR